MSLRIGHAKEIGMEETIAFLKQHERFLLVGHEHPDGDDVGSICALHNVLVSLGNKQTWFSLTRCRKYSAW